MQLPNSTRVGKDVDLRLLSDHIHIGENVVIDDFVRIVVPRTGKLRVGNDVKLGKGSILNCGGSITIADNTSLYGYCCVQSSRWHWEADRKEYEYFEINIGENVILAPHSCVCGSVNIPSYFEGQPGEVVGKW